MTTLNYKLNWQDGKASLLHVLFFAVGLTLKSVVAFSKRNLVLQVQSSVLSKTIFEHVGRSTLYIHCTIVSSYDEWLLRVTYSMYINITIKKQR